MDKDHSGTGSLHAETSKSYKEEEAQKSELTNSAKQNSQTQGRFTENFETSPRESKSINQARPVKAKSASASSEAKPDMTKITNNGNMNHRSSPLSQRSGNLVAHVQGNGSTSAGPASSPTKESEARGKDSKRPNTTRKSLPNPASPIPEPLSGETIVNEGVNESTARTQLHALKQSQHGLGKVPQTDASHDDDSVSPTNNSNNDQSSPTSNRTNSYQYRPSSDRLRDSQRGYTVTPNHSLDVTSLSGSRHTFVDGSEGRTSLSARYPSMVTLTQNRSSSLVSLSLQPRRASALPPDAGEAFLQGMESGIQESKSRDSTPISPNSGSRSSSDQDIFWAAGIEFIRNSDRPMVFYTARRLSQRILGTDPFTFSPEFRDIAELNERKFTDKDIRDDKTGLAFLYMWMQKLEMAKGNSTSAHTLARMLYWEIWLVTRWIGMDWASALLDIFIIFWLNLEDLFHGTVDFLWTTIAYMSGLWLRVSGSLIRVLWYAPEVVTLISSFLLCRTALHLMSTSQVPDSRLFDYIDMPPDSSLIAWPAWTFSFLASVSLYVIMAFCLALSVLADGKDTITAAATVTSALCFSIVVRRHVHLVLRGVGQLLGSIVQHPKRFASFAFVSGIGILDLISRKSSGRSILQPILETYQLLCAVLPLWLRILVATTLALEFVVRVYPGHVHHHPTVVCVYFLGMSVFWTYQMLISAGRIVLLGMCFIFADYSLLQFGIIKAIWLFYESVPENYKFVLKISIIPGAVLGLIHNHLGTEGMLSLLDFVLYLLMSVAKRSRATRHSAPKYFYVVICTLSIFFSGLWYLDQDFATVQRTVQKNFALAPLVALLAFLSLTLWAFYPFIEQTTSESWNISTSTAKSVGQACRTGLQMEAKTIQPVLESCYETVKLSVEGYYFFSDLLQIPTWLNQALVTALMSVAFSKIYDWLVGIPYSVRLDMVYNDSYMTEPGLVILKK